MTYTMTYTGKEMNRENILSSAMERVTRDRNEKYGEPEDNFSDIAKLWTDYLKSRDVEVITSRDVAMMMILFKIARAKSAGTFDTYVDICGYAACAAECEKGDNYED